MNVVRKTHSRVFHDHYLTLLFPSRMSSLKPVKDFSKLALIPLGGSTVILLPFWSTGTGNLALGMLVSQMRKSRWTTLGSICSTSRSRLGIQEGAKWQFWKKTHCPRSMALRIMASARGPFWTYIQPTIIPCINNASYHHYDNQCPFKSFIFYSCNTYHTCRQQSLVMTSITYTMHKLSELKLHLSLAKRDGWQLP